MANAIADTNGNASHKFDPNFTQNVIDAMGPKTSPRMREVMGCLIKHVHDFAREVELTVDEWMLGVELLNEAGKMSDHKRNEGQLVCDVIGLESYVLILPRVLARISNKQTSQTRGRNHIQKSCRCS